MIKEIKRYFEKRKKEKEFQEIAKMIYDSLKFFDY